MINFDDANKKGKEAMDAMLKNYSEVAKGFQAIATETSEYSKKSFQDVSPTSKRCSGVKSIETAFELQTNFAEVVLRELRRRGHQDERNVRRSRQDGLQALRSADRQGDRHVDALRGLTPACQIERHCKTGRKPAAGLAFVPPCITLERSF